jgi:murein hydrolase activator
MKQWRHQFICCLGLITLLLLRYPTPIYAAHPYHTPQTSLKQVEQTIARLTNTLNQQQQRYQQLMQDLQKTELTMAHSQKKLYHNNTQITLHQNKLHQLNQQKLALTYQQRRLKNKITLLLSLNSTMQQSSLINYLFNHQDFIKHHESLQYLDYFIYHLSQLQQRNHVLKRTLQHKMHAITLETNKIKKHTLNKNKSTVLLENLNQQRLDIISHLKEHIIEKQQRLTILKQNKHHLEQLIYTLNQDDSTLYNTNHFVFQHHHGTLIWPVSGTLKIKQHYHAHQDLSVTLLTQPKSTIYTIAPGKVVFAQWIQHYGLTLIVQHDHHYLSVYGHMSLIYQQVGDPVKLGEPIGLTGRSGGVMHHQLYFALRHNSTPMNPKKWCIHHQ